MRETIPDIPESFRKKIQARRRRKRILVLSSLLVLIGTTAALTLPAITQAEDVFCGLEEHTHGDACYTSQLICQTAAQDTAPSTTGPPDATAASTGPPETQAPTEPVPTEAPHEHTDSCYEQVLTCGKTEHGHTIACLSDPNADTETAEKWESSLPQPSGKPAADLAATAASQLGYSESKRNYTITNDGQKGYTRYGAWYGDPYGDWNVTFAAFCAHYANVTAVPKTHDLAAVLAQLTDSDLYRDAKLYTPRTGDLIFLDTGQDGIADLVGITESCSTAGITVTAIYGDVSGQVQKLTHSLTDAAIVGYAQLSEAAAEGTPSASSLINVSGTVMYHPPEHLDYQYSSHRVNNYMALTYVLVPFETYAADWQPSTLNWSAAANANYVVAYCADRNTDIGESGVQYTTQKLLQSAYANCAEGLAGIVEHSYPFITASQLRTELQKAYEKGEISIDLSCCTESDFIAAAQWAIWDMTGLSGTQTTAARAEFPEYNSAALNPLINVGHTDAPTIQSHVKAIRDWLMTCRAAPRLEIGGHTATVTRNDEGTYDMVVDITLNRPIEEQELVMAAATAGSRTFEMTVQNGGTQGFTLELPGLTEAEVLSTTVDLSVSLRHMQVYIYDSATYQDMISGQWGTTDYRLSLEVEVPATSVDVTKHWTGNDVGAQYITVQLYADGKAYGEPVRLSADNDWTHTWEKLLKYSSGTTPIDYTIRESLVPNFLTRITRSVGGTRSETLLEPADGFEENARYVLIHTGTNAMADQGVSGSGYLEWQRDTNLGDPAGIPVSAMWTATDIDGYSACLQNDATHNYLHFNGSNIVTAAAPSAKAFYLPQRLYMLNGINNQYLTYLHEGVGYVTADWDSGLDVQLYKLTRREYITADISFVITNTRSERATSVAVQKQWAGRTDEAYPESITLQLLQNGEPYGPEVVLSGENSWYYKWESLPETLGDTTYTYTVQEEALTGYQAVLEQTVAEDGTVLLTLTNNWAPDYIAVNGTKVDAKTPTLALSGAVFSLYRVSDHANAELIPGAEDFTGFPEQVILAGDDGSFTIDMLIVGETYYLVEIRSPDGYNRLPKPIVLQAHRDAEDAPVLNILDGGEWAVVGADAEGAPTLQVANEKGYIMPETGGFGTAIFPTAGLVLLILAAGLWIINNKKSKYWRKYQ